MKSQLKPKRCKTKNCKHLAFYAGYCKDCLAPGLGPVEPIRYWPPVGREQAKGRITRSCLWGLAVD